MDYAKVTSVLASTARALRPYFEIDPKTESRFMWVYQRMFDLHYTANLLESNPGSKPEQTVRQVGKFRQELSELQAEIDEMSKEYPQIAAYIKTVPYPGEKRPAQSRRQAQKKRRRRQTKSASVLRIRFPIPSVPRGKTVTVVHGSGERK